MMVKTLRLLSVIGGIITVMMAAPTLACTPNNMEGNPGVEGEIEYFTTDNMLRYCDGTEWIDMVDARPTATGGGGGCTSGYCGGEADKRIVFLADVAGNADDLPGGGGVSGADLLCQNTASAAGLRGDYLAWIADSNANTAPAQRFERSSVPYAMTDSTQVDDNWTELISGDIDNNINRLATGSQFLGERNALTNVDTDGTQFSATNTCSDYTSTTGSSRRGDSRRDFADWTTEGADTLCSGGAYLYCFEQLGPKHHWTFDEGTGAVAADSIEGTTSKEIPVNGVENTWATGIRGGALEFYTTGSGSRASTTNNQGSSLNDQFTISTWVNFDSLPGNRSWIGGQWGNTSANNAWGIEVNSNTLRLITHDGTSQTTSDTGWTPSLGQWYLITFTRSTDGTVRFYRDGQFQQAFTSVTAPQKIADEFRFGENKSTFELDGKLDDFRIYNYALDASEVRELYEGPVHHWRLDEGTGNDITDDITGTTTTSAGTATWADGAIDGASVFEGTDDYFNTGEVLNVDTAMMCAWIMPEGAGTRGHPIAYGHGGDHVYSVRWHDNDSDGDGHIGVRYQFNDGDGIDDGENYVYSGEDFNAGQWHHVCSGIDGDANRIIHYVNGSLRGDTEVPAMTFADFSTTGSPTFWIGTRAETTGAPNLFEGRIDDVRVYTRILSAAEVSDLYEAGVDKVGLIGHWKLDETGTTTTAVDSSGNGNDGTMINMTAGASVNGPVDTALDPSGPSSIVMGDINLLDFGTNQDFSLSAWVQYNPTSTATHTIIDKGRGILNNAGYVIFLDNGQITARIGDGTGTGSNGRTSVTSNATNLNNGLWRLVTATFDRDGDLSLYIDGVLDNSAAITIGSDSIDNAEDFVLFRDPEGRFFRDGMDDVRVYNRVLSADEVAALYAAGDGNIPCSNAGEYFYNAQANVYQWCDGSVLRFMGPILPPDIHMWPAREREFFDGSGGASSMAEGTLGFNVDADNKSYIYSTGNADPHDDLVVVGKACEECGGSNDTKVAFWLTPALGGADLGAMGGGVTAADKVCQRYADFFGLSGTYYAWLATSSADEPATRFSSAIRSDAYDIRLPNGNLIASNWSALLNSASVNLVNAIEVQPNAHKIGVGGIFTAANIDTDGTVISTTDHCSNFTSDTGTIAAGRRSERDEEWTNETGRTIECYHLNFYCFEQ